MAHFFAVFLIQFVSSKMHSFVCETFNAKSNYKLKAVVVVKWSTYSPSTSTIRVQIPLKPTISFVKFVFE